VGNVFEKLVGYGHTVFLNLNTICLGVFCCWGGMFFSLGSAGYGGFMVCKKMW